MYFNGIFNILPRILHIVFIMRVTGDIPIFKAKANNLYNTYEAEKINKRVIVCVCIVRLDFNLDCTEGDDTLLYAIKHFDNKSFYVFNAKQERT